MAGGMSECAVTLDDSVSEEEEEECSFDELTDVTPYLQPGVELSVLNQVRQERAACSCNSSVVVNMLMLNIADSLAACGYGTW